MATILSYIISFIAHFVKIIYFIIDKQKTKGFNRVLLENYFIFTKQKHKSMHPSSAWCGLEFFQRKATEPY